MIVIRVDSESVAAGEFLSGEVRWAPEGEAPLPRVIVMSAEWEIDATGHGASGRGRATRFTPKDNHGEVVAPFRLMIPFEGPVSFIGHLIVLTWKLKVRADLRGHDERAELDFQVVPRRRNV